VHPLLALALLALAGIAAAQLPWRRPPLALAAAVATGLPLLLGGLVLGPGIDLVDRTTLRALAPVLALAIGWIGAALGARFQWRQIRRIPRAVWLLAAVQAAATTAVLGAAVWGLLRALPPLRAAWAPAGPTLATLAAVVIVSGPGAVAVAARAAGLGRRLERTLTRAAALDAALGVIVSIIALASLRDAAAGFAGSLILAIATGALAGLLFLTFARLRPVIADLDITLLGVLLFAAGAAYAAGTSPLFACALAAALIVNLFPRRRAARALLEAGERNASVGLWIAAGALLALPTIWILFAAVAIGFVRVFVRWAVSRYAPVALQPAPPGGLGTVAPGGLALAVALPFGLLRPGAGALLATVAVAVLLAQLVAPAAIGWAMRSRVPPLTATHPAAELG
jgi:hypothetical protein